MTTATHTNPLDLFIADMRRFAERAAALPVACVLSKVHPCAEGLPPSIYGLAAAYDASLCPQQGPLFFADQADFQRYVSQIQPSK